LLTISSPKPTVRRYGSRSTLEEYGATRTSVRAARRAGRKDVRELLTLRSQLREAVTHGEPLRYSRLNWRLNQRVMAIAAQPVAAALVDAIVAGDPVAAGDATRRHLASAIDTLTASAPREATAAQPGS
jgi:DNA-binding GntR family transcriptional regulator